ncbi:tetratricopeptide repeat protein [Pseudomonas sp. Hz4]
MRKIILATLIGFSVSAVAEIKVYPLAPSFHGAEKVEFVSIESENGKTVKGNFLSSNGQRYSIPDTCEPEGGDPKISDAYSVQGKENYFVFECAWTVQHSGIGLDGTQYETFVYSGKDVTSVVKNKALSQALSGYEGSLEEGDRSYAWYSKRKIASEKLLELESGKTLDSLALAHEIAIIRLKDSDYEAIKSYLSSERIELLFKDSPVSKSTVVAYNDIGYALGQAGETSLAYQVLKKVEQISPDRIVLKLNIADVLWVTEKNKSKAYYKEYIGLMKKAGKETLIPTQAIERSASN